MNSLFNMALSEKSDRQQEGVPDSDVLADSIKRPLYHLLGRVTFDSTRRCDPQNTVACTVDQTCSRGAVASWSSFSDHVGNS